MFYIARSQWDGRGIGMEINKFILNKSILISLVFFASSLGFAQENSNCISASSALEILKVFDIINAGPSQDLCHSQSLTARVFRSLIDLKNLKELDATPSDINKNLIDVLPFEFIKQRVKTIHLDTNEKSSTCQPGVVAYVRNSTTKTLYVCPFAATLTNIALQSNLMHEARHLDDPKYVPGSYDKNHPDIETAYPHTLCQEGDFKDYEACDESPISGGSYGIQTEFLIRLSHTSSLSLEDRQFARALAIIYLLDHFDSLPFVLKTGALLLSESGTLSFYDGSDAPRMDLLKNIKEHQVVALRTLPTILDSVEGTAKSYVGDVPIDTPGAFSKIYREQFDAEKKSQVLDVYYGGMTACFLFSDSVYCEMGKDSVNMRLPEGFIPVQFNIMSLFGGDLVMIVNPNGELYSLPLKKPSVEWNPEQLEKNKTLVHFKSVTLLPNVFNLGILLDGSLVTFKTKDELIPVTQYQNERFKKILSPFKWAERFQNL